MTFTSLATNAHLGRRVASHHSGVYVYGFRNEVGILDSDKTLNCQRSALYFLRSLFREKGCTDEFTASLDEKEDSPVEYDEGRRCIHHRRCASSETGLDGDDERREGILCYY